MTKETYIAQRGALLNDAKAKLDAGELDAFAEIKGKVEALDAQYEAEAKAAANLSALAGSAVVTDMAAQSKPVTGAAVEEITGAAPTDEPTNSDEYRRAFMNYVVSGKAIPDNLLNVDHSTQTGDVGVLIPQTIVQRILEKMESVGMILPLVTHTSYKGGVKIPLSTVKPVASWVAEGKGSDKQFKSITGSIDFAYNKLRCAISVSLETDVMAMPVFESVFASNVAEAMAKSKEQAIMFGTGSGQPKGILTETPAVGQALEIVANGKLGYDTLVSAEAALPLAYEAGAVWLMTKKTFMAFAGMVDGNGQPIARTNYGIGGRPERMLLGRNVILNEYMESYADTVTKDTIFAALFSMKDYVLNSNMNLTVKRYEDNDTDDLVTKAIELVDGRVIDKGSLVTLTKKAASAPASK